MLKKHIFSCDKVVRSKCLEHLKEKGIHPETRVLDAHERIKYLKKKLHEEALEVEEAKDPSEAVDKLINVWEALVNLRDLLGLKEGEFRRLYEERHEKFGSYKDGLCLTRITLDEDNPEYPRYARLKHKYREIHA